MPINLVPGPKKVTELSDSDIVKVDSGDTLRVGDIEIEFLHTPAYPRSQCFRVKNTLVSGDTLFINGCGRVDHPARTRTLPTSQCKLCTLPDDTLLLRAITMATCPTPHGGDQANEYLFAHQRPGHLKPLWAANAPTVRRGNYERTY